MMAIRSAQYGCRRRFFCSSRARRKFLVATMSQAFANQKRLYPRFVDRARFLPPQIEALEQAEEIDSARTAKGGFDRATLAAWGIGWPPPKGWRQMLIDGVPIPEPGIDGEPATSVRPSACPEASLLRQVVMAIIENGHGEILAGVPELNAYYGFELPTVAHVIGGRPPHAVITGGISFDDKVYSFRCEAATASK
jgi:hypothetical protein